ncbi:hypothetical protein AB4254_08970 [Vibrio breoganii]
MSTRKLQSSDFQHSFKDGQNAEKLFATMAEARGYKTILPTLQQDIKSHIDLIIEKDGRTITVDIKAMKRISRGKRDNSSGKSSNVHWIELKNVQGKPGWIYGEQDLLAFETETNFILVPRTELRDYITATVSVVSRVHSPTQAYQKLYSRKGRADLITTLKNEDLLLLSHKLWTK